MITKARFVYNTEETEEEYAGEIENVKQLKERAFKWLREIGADTREQTRDEIFPPTSRRITFENGILDITHEFVKSEEIDAEKENNPDVFSLFKKILSL